MKVHLPETWRIAAFQYASNLRTYGGPLEFWRGVHNVRLHSEGKTLLNVMIFFEDAISFDEQVPQNVICFLRGPLWVKAWKNVPSKTKLKPSVDGRVSKQPKCGWVAGQENRKLPFAMPLHPHVPWSQHT